MIKKLRFRFVLVTMACISFIFVLILSVINISMTLSSRAQGYALLSRLSDNFPEDGHTPRERRTDGRGPISVPDSESPADSPDRSEDGRRADPVGGFDAFRSFSVLYDSAGRIEEVSFQNNSDFTEAEIRSLADRVIANPKERGVISRYLYITKTQNTGTRIYFLDYSMEKSLSLRLFWTCLFIGLLGILFIFILVFFLSRWVVLPVQTAFERQKQFIADASHELKTPLTIITTNAEVLAAGLGDNKWLNHILAQTGRMSALIRNLLELAKLYSGRESLLFTEFDMSTAVKNAALSFESVAYEYGKQYEMDIADNIVMTGNEDGIRQLTTILLDNAFKYSEDRGSVALSLVRHGEKKILVIENSGKEIAREDQARIFERFYRSDTSRSRESGGYGLGLAIASSIVQAHKGHIQVKSAEQTRTRFIVTFP